MTHTHRSRLRCAARAVLTVLALLAVVAYAALAASCMQGRPAHAAVETQA